MILSSGVAK